MLKPEARRSFVYGQHSLQLGGPTVLCAILNVTPDSFSDGGRYFNLEDALRRGRELVAAGAGMLDIGGESTRPGSEAVPAAEEIRRIVPVIQTLAAELDVPISVDTWKAEVAEAALSAGADIINDITGLMGDPAMAEVLARHQAGLILMFNPVLARPNHPGSTIFPKFGQNPFSPAQLADFAEMDILELMERYFDCALERAAAAGLGRDHVMLDPGIGFGLTKRENFLLIQQIKCLQDWGFASFLGVSRKRFISNLLSDAGFDLSPETAEGLVNRDEASSKLTSLAALLGVDVVRIHTLEHHAMAAAVGDAVRLAADLDNRNFAAYAKKS